MVHERESSRKKMLRKGKIKTKTTEKIIELASECIPHEHIMQSGKTEKERRYEKDR